MCVRELIILTIALFLTACSNEKKERNLSRKSMISSTTKNYSGEYIFDINCSSCHAKSMIYDMTAPPLGGVFEKRGKEWTYAYTRNAWSIYEKGDSIAASLRAKGWGMMPAYENLSDADLDSLYAYIEYQYQLNK